MKVALRSILVAVLIFAAYQALYSRLPRHWQAGGRAGSEYERNVMRAEEFYYSADAPRVVVVGSSISSRLLTLPEDWFNLAFSGGSTFTGLDIVTRSDKTPAYVLIEVNVLTRGLESDVVDRMADPLLDRAHRTFPVLLEASKPTHVLERAMDPTSREGMTQAPPGRSSANDPVAIAQSREPVPEPDHPVWMKEDFYHELIRHQVEVANTPWGDVEQIVAMMHRYVDALEARGSKVIFFMVPEHPEVMKQWRLQTLGGRVMKEFPSPRYAWTPVVDANDYHTTDGVHLTGPGAIRYAGILVQTLKSIEAAKR